MASQLFFQDKDIKYIEYKIEYKRDKLFVEVTNKQNRKCYIRNKKIGEASDWKLYKMIQSYFSELKSNVSIQFNDIQNDKPSIIIEYTDNKKCQKKCELILEEKEFTEEKNISEILYYCIHKQKKIISNFMKPNYIIAFLIGCTFLNAFRKKLK